MRYATGMFRRFYSLLVAAALLAGCGGASSPPTAPAAPASTEAAASAPPPASEAPAKIAVRVLLVTWAGAVGAPAEVTRTEAQARARADVVGALARQPETSFRELVGEYGDAPDRVLQLERRGGVLPGPVEDAAFALAVGEVSHPIQTPNGFYVVERGPDPPTGPTVISAKHILVSYQGARRADAAITRTREEAYARAEEALERARAHIEDWPALVEEYSDEPSHSPDGDLGTFGRGRMVPSFERAAFALDVGELAGPVESPFGFHVIYRYQ